MMAKQHFNWQHNFDMVVKNGAPPLYDSVTHGYVYGRWREPMQSEIVFPGLGWVEKFLNLKQFDYTSISTLDAKDFGFGSL